MALITSVTATGGTHCIWQFDTAVASVADLLGFDINGGMDALSIVSIVGGTVTIDYGGIHSPGEPWAFDATLAGATFTNGATTIDQSGTVI